MDADLRLGDCLSVIKTIPDGTAQTCVTSPPYWGLRDYGTEGQLGLEKTPEEYVTRMVEVFREVRRVLRDDGTLWLNLGDSYCGGGRGCEGKGWEQGADTKRRIMPSSLPRGLKSKDLVGIPWRVAFALQSDGWYLRQDIIWHKPNPMPESVTDRCTKAHEYIFLLSKSERYYYDAGAVAEPSITGDTRKPYGSDGAWAMDGRNKWEEGKGKQRDHADGTTRNRRSVWTVATKPYKGAHFATFPPDLIEPCILAGCPRGGVVLEPFLGSGTTAMVALQNGRGCLGIELNPEYLALARERIARVQPTLFDLG